MAGVALIDWDALGPYRVAFSTREGGVSEGAYASLNLGIRTEDDPASVVENRRRLCEAVGADATKRDQLRQYITDLATQNEQEFAVVEREAQRCRDELNKVPPRPAAAPAKKNIKAK